LVVATISVEELPAVIEVGFATMVTVGAAAATTVTDAAEEAFPPVPLTLAV
jgi:hypothetical protein